ncbi:MAG: chemotaxis protein CheA [Gemmatimonadales bacterium]
MDLARYTTLFLSDSRDHLQRCNALLLEWERAPESGGPVAELFRSFHSIKGSAATLGFEGVADLAHVAEHLLEVVRSGAVAPSPAVVEVLFRAVDLLGQGVEAAGRGEAPPDPDELVAAVASLAPRVVEGAPERRSKPRPAPGGPGAVPSIPEQGWTAEFGVVRPVRQVRVNLDRLDSLVTEVGELVVARNRLATIADVQIGSELQQVSARISGIVAGMQRDVLRARMAPVAEVFDRFPRMVRDLARDLGKSVRFEVQGGDIELDRSVLDELPEPVTHLIRNAVDHGLEPPAEREAAGKPAEGTLRVRAERARDEVVVVVADDGRGINRAGVRTRAVEQGLVDRTAPAPDDGQLLRLLARPGFTLKREVTTVSGRGVGVDAVLAKVRSMGGRMELVTREGQGTTFLLRLPVTRAIVRALLVGCGAERYAIPFGLLAEAVVNERPVEGITLRGESLPSVDLRTVIGLPPADAGRRPVVVLDLVGRRGALIVDALLGQEDVVVEDLVAPLGTPPWISGGTVLPDGLPALILDPTALF